MHRTGAIRFTQFLYTLANKHERHPAALILLDPVERAADRRKERSQKKIVRDYAGCCCGKVFFMHLCAPFGRWIMADRYTFPEDAGRPFFIRFQKPVNTHF
jgi:hypothetical protein